jgi:broad specificity phosphatase PhoE
MTRLLLIRHGPTLATERGAFAVDEPITESGRAAAAGLRGFLPASGAVVVSSPLRRCRQTAEAIGCRPRIEPDLAECHFGAWEGRTFAEISAHEPDLLAVWLRDADAAPHGGESLVRFTERIGAWLMATADRPDQDVVAFTHAGVIKSAVISALQAPLAAFWRITVAPLSITELHMHDRSWTLLRLNWTAVGA